MTFFSHKMPLIYKLKSKPMHENKTIWVDADACPRAIKAIIFRVADRIKIQTVFVTNNFIKVPKSEFIKLSLVGGGFDVADNEIIKRLKILDLVITSDVPLAADVVKNGAYALNPRGTLYTKENAKELLNQRNSREIMRETGDVTGGPAPFTPKDTKRFAQSLDKFVVRHLKIL